MPLSVLILSLARRFALCLGVLLLGSPFAYAKDQVPDWVRSAASLNTASVARNADAVYLLEETSYTVAPDGSLIQHVRKVVRILRPQGRKYGEMYVGFNQGTKIKSLHIWSIGADGKEYSLKDSELSEVGTGAGFELYSDRRARGAMAPAMDVGAVAALEYELQERPYENDIVWIPGESVPVLRERLSLNLPDGYSYRTAWKGKAKADAVDAEHGRTLWEINDQAALHSPDRIPMAPHELSLAPRMDIFYQGNNVAGSYGAMNGDWQGIGEWYGRLAKDRNQPDAAITAKAQELVQGKTGFRERTEAIAGFVQSNIRYVAIEIGVGGHQPHAASQIFQARYGDCKDKATLLSAMLNAVGIRSTWVLVDTERGVMAGDAPSIIANHMIAAIELPADYKPEGMYSIVTAKSGKRFLIFDPTWEKTPFGHLEHELQGSDALLIDGADSQAIRLPVLQPEQNTIHRKASFQLAADGALSGTVTEDRGGDIARERRYLFTQGTQKEQEKEFDLLLSRDLGEFSLADLKAEHAAELQRDITISYSLKATHFAREMGTLLTVRPRILGDDQPPVDGKKREVPIDLGSTRKIHDEFAITLPTNFDVDELPAAVNLDLGFATYRSESRVKDHVLYYDRTYTVREVALPAERYPDLQKLARVIAADEESSAILKHHN